MATPTERSEEMEMDLDDLVDDGVLISWRLRHGRYQIVPRHGRPLDTDKLAVAGTFTDGMMAAHIAWCTGTLRLADNGIPTPS